MRRAFTAIVVAIAGCGTDVGPANPAASRPPPARVPTPPAAGRAAGDGATHAGALRLVFDACGDRIRAVDGGDADVDTEPRAWHVRRPFDSGMANFTHLFTVWYEVNGRAVAAWSVDTYRRTATELRLPAVAAGSRFTFGTDRPPTP